MATDRQITANRLNAQKSTGPRTPIGKLQIGEVQSGRTYNLILDDAAFDIQRIGL